MSKKNKLHFVSIEGNWDKDIHDKRIAYGASILKEDEFSFAIASGTYAPPSYSSFYEGRLGEYTRETLIKEYGIQAMRILPFYIHDYRCICKCYLNRLGKLRLKEERRGNKCLVRTEYFGISWTESRDP